MERKIVLQESPEFLRHFVAYMYTGVVSSGVSYLDFMIFANMYQMWKLQEYCEDQLVNQGITVDNIETYSSVVELYDFTK